jgi:hypothetical protein
MNKRVGKWVVAGLVVLLGFGVGYQLPASESAPVRPAAIGTSAVLSDSDQQALAQQERALCIDIVEEETQNGLAKAGQLADKAAAAVYRQRILTDRNAQLARCQANYPED